MKKKNFPLNLTKVNSFASQTSAQEINAGAQKEQAPVFWENQNQLNILLLENNNGSGGFHSLIM